MKTELRKQFLHQRRRLGPGILLDFAERIHSHILQLPAFQTARVIASYVDFDHEVPTRQLIERTLALGKKVAVPRMHPTTNSLSFHSIESLDELKPNSSEIFEPMHLLIPVLPEQIKLIVIPGIAFDETGHRLGYGQGYFDRALQSFSHAFKVGICLEEFVVARLPHQPHDIPMNALVTETQTRFFQQPNAENAGHR